MTRIEFCAPYLVALYMLNRKQSNIRQTVNELLSLFFLPHDKYLEGEVVGHMLHQGWIVAQPGDPSAGMIITEQGKILAEQYIDQGVKVREIIGGSLIDTDASQVSGAEMIPASDRIVLLTDNQPAVEAVRTSLSELSAQLENANDVGEMTLLDVEQARSEIWHLEEAFKAERVRVAWIEPLAKNSLKWIAEKAAGAAVGKAALAVIAAIAALFGFSF